MSDTLHYLYAFIPSSEYESRPPDEMEGIQKNASLQYLPLGSITAVTCHVHPDEFSEENLAKNTENMAWLQEKAFHHHQMMNQLHKSYTVIPLKFGTIYTAIASLKAAVQEHEENILSLFQALQGKEEWNMKIYVKDDKFREKVMAGNQEIEKKQQEIEQLSKGKQYFEKKKMGQFIEEQVKKEIETSCKQVHQKLKIYSQAEELKKNWGKKVTGKTDGMYWNSAYLLPRGEVEAFLETIKQEQAEASRKETGLTFEVTGPWPAYHFSNFQDRGVQHGT
ncbi:GvpL/GvpF family gas vesicle protein [Sediminibacillus albus]|uniref:Gas vesicle synthesis protein GvpL/GvpF n=1 Tax=Sediminibacillus albus TaxID=407036 RepID=A0A1G8Y6B5_9BACI|nr:GvpL/GvpF family gas vesicle protein [Sediminibacillus albus]SDJ97705.1 Gas vesicle synthesis protein GvpL/GvpF [Sediminibacillus albus]